MPLSKEEALDILGLPSFAVNEHILLRYRHLALDWFPEKHNNSEYSLEVFRNITEATITLFRPGEDIFLDLERMYSFFQQIFFGSGKPDKNDDLDVCDCHYHEDSDSSISDFEDGSVSKVFLAQEEKRAAHIATELILEEEEEKAKSARKKAKKKKRKEKKKQEKSELQADGKVLQQSPQSNDLSEKKSKKNEILKYSDSEEEIDPTSAFVSVVAKKHRKQSSVVQTKETSFVPNNYNVYQPELPEENDEDPEIIILKSREFALEGNAKANEGRYTEAVGLFTKSIELDPSDHRFYGNRSYCYERLDMFDKALKDAEKAIKLSPVWAKNYYRKGRALLGLKKYATAEKYFKEVLKLDNDCEDAICELRKAKLLQIMENGYTKEVAEVALARHGSVADALANLLSSGVSRIQVQEDLGNLISDDEVENIDKVAKVKPAPAVSPASQNPFYDIKKDPNNPEGHNSIWIGNVQPDVTEKKLTTMFGKFGDLLSVKVIPGKHCAFVNYKSKLSPGKAMQAYQGMELSGYNLLIRFPNSPGEPSAPTPIAKKKPGVIGQEKKLNSPVNGNECYFWRTTGCTYGDNCRYKHIKEHKGVDKKPWQVS